MKYKVGDIVSYGVGAEFFAYCRIKEIRQRPRRTELWGSWFSKIEDVDKDKAFAKDQWGYMPDNDVRLEKSLIPNWKERLSK